MASEMPPLVWIDCEMTGLDLSKDALIEIAVLVTDENLNLLGEGIDLVIETPREKLASMSEEVRAMHTESGLLEKLRGGVSMGSAGEDFGVLGQIHNFRKISSCRKFHRYG